MGIQSHSQPSSKYCVFSGFKATNTKLNNLHNHSDILDTLELEQINYKELWGSYHGIPELSVIINFKNFELALALAIKYEQESILILHETEAHGLRKAYLYFIREAREEFIGYLKSVPRERAEASNDYSYDPLQDQYFIVVKDREVFI